MEIRTEDYEKLGAFYLGREYDLGEKELEDDLVLYDSKDLVTHGVVLGMTGSGKTGLCIALLEEAAMDSIPAIVIDPKGDIPNLMLTFQGANGLDRSMCQVTGGVILKQSLLDGVVPLGIRNGRATGEARHHNVRDALRPLNDAVVRGEPACGQPCSHQPIHGSFACM